jgi:hypothetical protein
MQRIRLVVEQISDMGVAAKEIPHHPGKMTPEDKTFVGTIHVVSSGLV